MSVDTKEFKFTADTTQAEANVKKLQTSMAAVMSAAYGILGILRRMGLSEEITQAITDLQRLISTLNMAYVSAMALYSASGPIGWALAGIGVAGTAITVYDTLDSQFDRMARR